jgi:methylated-DNA-[protein]-cysteine S-methyltransferase
MSTTELPIAAFDTELGRCAVRWTDSGISGVLLPSRHTEDAPSLADVPNAPPFVRAAAEGIAAVLSGDGRSLRDVPIDERGLDPFRRAVYDTARSIPPGTTTTYGQVARALGRTDAEAARAVGAALAANPFPVVVPCHRVIAANGARTGFSAPGGLATKRRMLELEGAPGFGQQVLFG